MKSTRLLIYIYFIISMKGAIIYLSYLIIFDLQRGTYHFSYSFQRPSVNTVKRKPIISIYYAR